jgi:MFS family permease
MTIELQQPDDAGKRKQIALGLMTVFTTFFVYSYFLQILLSAYQKIVAELDGMKWYSLGVSIPMLGLAFAMLVVGKLSDMYGRRALFIVSLVVSIIGAVLCGWSPTFEMLIIARTIFSIGQGGLAPLCYSALGDMFEPVQRSRWIGLLNIPVTFFALIGPPLGGKLVDIHKWRYIFWCGVPLLIVCLIMVIFCLSDRNRRAAARIDSRGALFAAVASSTMLLGFSIAGKEIGETIYRWSSPQVLGLLAVSIVFWWLFLKAESRAEEPILDLQLLKNRAFITLASAGLLSSFGMTGLGVYYPLMLQGIQEIKAEQYGYLLIAGAVLMNFMGVPAGFLIARTKRYKWMFILGYGISLAVTIALVFFNARTPLSLSFAAMTLAMLGIGCMPTVNTIVAQYSVPKRLLGVSMGALYFSVMIGQALAPAILGSVMNTKYTNTLKASLPAELSQLTDQRVLLDETAKATLQAKLIGAGNNGQALFDKTISATRDSMEAGLKVVFIIGAITMLLTFITICTIPQIPMGAVVKDETAANPPPSA